MNEIRSFFVVVVASKLLLVMVWRTCVGAELIFLLSFFYRNWYGIRLDVQWNNFHRHENGREKEKKKGFGATSVLWEN